MQTVYLETSIISYLTAKPSDQVVVAGHQFTTRDWWDNQSQFYALVASELVIEEASRGDLNASERRLDLLKTVTIVMIDPIAIELATLIVDQGLVPKKAAADALHIAIANRNKIDFLLTWNCKHIANAVTRPRMEEFFRQQGYQATVICTPEELMME